MDTAFQGNTGFGTGFTCFDTTEGDEFNFAPADSRSNELRAAALRNLSDLDLPTGLNQASLNGVLYEARQLARGGFWRVYSLKDASSQDVLRVFDPRKHQPNLFPIVLDQLERAWGVMPTAPSFVLQYESIHLGDEDLLAELQFLGHTDSTKYPFQIYTRGPLVQGSTIYNLKTHLSKKAASTLGFSIDLAEQLLPQLEESLKKGLLHRDLHPKNLMWSEGKLTWIDPDQLCNTYGRAVMESRFLGSAEFAHPAAQEIGRTMWIPTADLYSGGKIIQWILDTASSHSSNRPSLKALNEVSRLLTLEAEQSDVFERASQALGDARLALPIA